MPHIVAYRFSAMGDVLNTLPVFKGLLRHNQDIKITFITRKDFVAYFDDIPRLNCVGVDFKGEYKGRYGVKKLSKRILSLQPDLLFDLHQVLRSHYLNHQLKKTKIPLYRINKDRKLKKKILKNKQITQLPHITELYERPFKEAGIEFKLESIPVITPKLLTSKIDAILHTHKHSHLIGIAPFARHEQKEWGIKNIRAFIEHVNSVSDSIRFVLFGAGPRETSIMEELCKKYKNVYHYFGQIDRSEEIQLISRLNAMLSMDSANMHLASLIGIPTFSIWGPTHPCFGYAPIAQPENYIFKIPNGTLKCHPCSVYGNKKCIHKTKKCMDLINPIIIGTKVLESLKKSQNINP